MLTIMKTKKYILFALAVLGLTTSCMKGDWNAPSDETGMAAYGNQDIKATNLKTIAELKALYATEINGNSLAQVTKPMQIMGVVTGNDVGGNIYNSLYIQDNTGAIAISVGQGGLYGSFSVGQTVLIELNGLYVGGYGKQPQIGTTYTNPNKEGATPQVGRMTRYTWQEHYKLIPAALHMAGALQANTCSRRIDCCSYRSEIQSEQPRYCQRLCKTYHSERCDFG